MLSETYLQLNSTETVKLNRHWSFFLKFLSLFFLFGKHFLLVFFFCLFLSLILHQLLASPCNFNALYEECIISHTSFFIFKKVLLHIDTHFATSVPVAQFSKPFCQKYSNTKTGFSGTGSRCRPLLFACCVCFESSWKDFEH